MENSMEQVAQMQKALLDACRVINDLNECINRQAINHKTCPFREECGSTDGCLSTPEKWMEYLLKGANE